MNRLPSICASCAKRQTAAGDNEVRLYRHRGQLIEAAFLIRYGNLRPRQYEAKLLAALAVLDGEAFAGESADRDRVMTDAFLVQQTMDHFAGRPADW